MAVDAHKNFAISAVSVAPSPGTSGTSLDVLSGQGARFPATPFNATIWPTGVSPDPSNAEIVRVTNIATDTLTITRAQEGSTARDVQVGDKIAATVTAKTITDIENSLVTVIPFTIIGNAAQQTYGSRKYFFTDATLKKINISCGTAPGGTGNLVLQLKKNNVDFGTPVTVTNGSFYATSSQTLSISTNDYLQVAFTSIGTTPAANVIIELEIVT